MNRRPFLHALATGATILATGCLGSLPFTTTPPQTADVFERYRFDGTDLVVDFREGATIERAVLFDADTDVEYETVERPRRTVRFPVVFPERSETRVSGRLHVKAETPDGWAEKWVFGQVHGFVTNVEKLPDGRARFDVENQGTAPLLVRFVGVYGDVPNPTVNVQSDSFDRSSFDLGPSVVGVGRNRALTPSRTDLVIPPGETKPFETTYAPFAFPERPDPDCDGGERTGTAALLHASGGSASYTFTYRRDGEPTAGAGESASVCRTSGSSRD